MLSPQPNKYDMFGFWVTVGALNADGKSEIKYQIITKDDDDKEISGKIQQVYFKCEYPALTKNANLKLFGLCEDGTNNIPDGYVPFCSS